jgi:hypothetical protein
VAIAIVPTKTAPDAWSFKVTVDATSTQFTINYGDGTAPATITADPSKITTVTHTYVEAGHHTYTVTATAARTAWASTLSQINSKVATLAAIPAVPLAKLSDIPNTTDTASVTVAVDVGAATIWATIIPGDPIPVVQVDTHINSLQTVAQWEVSRDQANGSAPLYIGTSLNQDISFVDTTCPLGVPVTYRLTITYANATNAVVLSNPVTLTGTTGCFLTVPANGTTVAVTLAAWKDRKASARRSLLSVLGRADPVALSDVHSTPAGTWTLYTDTDAQTLALLAVLNTIGGVVVLRTQPGSSIPSVTASVGDITETRFTGAGGDQRRWIQVEVQEIAQLPATATQTTATLGGLATIAGPTLTALAALRPTQLQLSMVPTEEVATREVNV